MKGEAMKYFYYAVSAEYSDGDHYYFHADAVRMNEVCNLKDLFDDWDGRRKVTAVLPTSTYRHAIELAESWNRAYSQ